MQEEIENKTLTLIISGTRFSGRMLKAAITKFMASQKEQKYRRAQKKQQKGSVVHHGKQTVRELTRQGQGVANIDVNDTQIRDFERIARKYGVDYAVKKDRNTDPPRFVIFFKAHDNGAITAAFKEYTEKKVRKASRPSVREKLARFKAMIHGSVERVRKKVLER